MPNSFRFSRAQADARAIEVKVLLTRPEPPEGAFICGPWGWGKTNAEADAIIRQWRSLLYIVGLTIHEVAAHMVEYTSQRVRLDAERDQRRRKRHGSMDASKVFVEEMREILSKYGYEPSEATRLAEEGMGPHELEHRIRSTESGGVGSLEYTHRIHRRTHPLASAHEQTIMTVLHGGDPGPMLRAFYATTGKRRQDWLRALDARSFDQLDMLSKAAMSYGTASGVEMKDAIVDILGMRRSQGRSRR